MSWLETHKLPALFAVATLLPIAVLCWLGVRTLEQDRDLERQRRRERLDVAARRVALDIEQDLQQIEANLAEGDGISFLPSGIVTPRDEPLLFRPEVPSVSVLASAQLAAAARLEDRSPFEAIRAYERIASNAADPDRGEALVALGALLRRQRRFNEALRAYSDLETLGSMPVAGGQPAALVAMQGRAKTFLEAGDQVRLRQEAAAFARALSTGGWLIDRASFELYQHDMIEPWGGPSADAQAVRRAAAVAELWHQWRRGELQARGRRFCRERQLCSCDLGGRARCTRSRGARFRRTARSMAIDLGARSADRCDVAHGRTTPGRHGRPGADVTAQRDTAAVHHVRRQQFFSAG